MIPVSIETLLIGSPQEKSVIVLRPFMETGPNPRVLPIYIGVNEALALSMAINGRHTERPQTHDLTMNVIEKLGGEVLRVVIDRVEGLVFYSKVQLQQGDEIIEIDARPSDALVMAIKADVPVYVEPPVFVAAAVAYNAQRDDLQEREFEAFQEYIETIDPDDFNPIE